MVERFYGPLTGFEMRPGERGDYVRYSDYAALEAQLAALSAENKRLRAELKAAYANLREGEQETDIHKKPLKSGNGVALFPHLAPQTDASKKPLEYHLAQLRHAYSHLKEGTVVDQETFANGLISPAIEAIETAISALQPDESADMTVAHAVGEDEQEGQQDNEPVAWGVVYRGKIVAVSLHKGYHYTVPLYTSPSEQVVTEAMVEAVVQAVRPYTMQTLFIDEHRELVHDALKAGMEAGR